MDIEASSQPQERKSLVSTGPIIIGIIVVLVLALLTIWGVVGLARGFPAEIETVRDIFIIGLALESCVFGIVLMIMLVMIVRLVNTVEFEIKPILEQTNDTIGTVRGTTKFVSRNVVKPVVTVTGYAAGFRRGLRVLFGDPRKNLPD